MRATVIAAGILFGVTAGATAQEIPTEYQQVLTALGKQGDYKADVLKVNIPRNDVSVTVAGVKTPTPFGSGGWNVVRGGTYTDVDVERSNNICVFGRTVVDQLFGRAE